jgi:hypothetical protein
VTVTVLPGEEPPDCDPPAFDISGRYDERYNCSAEGVCVSDDVPYVITIYQLPDADPSEFEFSDMAGDWRGSGTLCGTVFEWDATGPGFTEEGTWTFSDARNFTKTSEYTLPPPSEDTGECTGSATQDGTPPAPAPVGACQ